MKKILIPFGLIFLWIVLLATQIFLIEKSYTLLSESYTKEIFGYDREATVLEGKKMEAKFVAKDNYLGIVSVNFDPRNKMVKGIITFRIKEEGSHKWYYENDYDAEQLNDLSFYPFGFPIIEQSKNKRYVISIELKNTSHFNSVLKLNRHSPALTTLYKYPKAPLVKSKTAFTAFLYKKVGNIIHNNYQAFGSIVCMYPFIFYTVWMLIEKKYLEKTLLGILLLTVLIDSIFIFQFFDMAYLTVAALWLLLTRSRKESPQYSYYVSFGLLIFCVISQLLNNNNIVEKSASWAFLFIVIAMAQDILLLRNEKVAS